MRDTGEFNVEYCLRKLFFDNCSKSGTESPIFADCSFDLMKGHILRVGLKPNVFSEWQHIDIDLHPFKSGNMEKDLKRSWRGNDNKGLYWFESMKD